MKIILIILHLENLLGKNRIAGVNNLDSNWMPRSSRPILSLLPQMFVVDF